MRVGVIDVGSNSVRLLVAAVESGGEVRELTRDRVYLRLGDDAYRFGRIGSRKLDELASVSDRFARRARAALVGRLETIVTAPGRQAANADELVELLEDATRSPVAVLTAEDEGRLAWEGAVSGLEDPPALVGVVDLGGGSCELALGSPATGPSWICSRDAGALRVTRRLLGSRRLHRRELARARAGVRELLDGVHPTQPDTALAVGGTARAVAKILGSTFGAHELDLLADRIASDGTASVTAGLDVTPARIETMLGGTLVLAEVARKLDARLEVGRGGVREGAALALARSVPIAA